MQIHTLLLASVSYLRYDCLECPEGEGKFPGTDPGTQHQTLKHCLNFTVRVTDVRNTPEDREEGPSLLFTGASVKLRYARRC